MCVCVCVCVGGGGGVSCVTNMSSASHYAVTFAQDYAIVECSGKSQGGRNFSPLFSLAECGRN